MTALISDDNMKKMRATQELNLPETAHLQKMTYEPDGLGGKIEKAMETIKEVKARIGEPKGELEKEQASRITGKVVSVITMPADTDLSEAEQIQIRGVNYHIHWTNKEKSNLTALRVIVTEV